MNTLGERIRVALSQKGWTQARLAQEMNVGQAAVNHWVNDKTRPYESNLRKLEDILGELRPATIGEWLYGARRKKGMSRKELADAAGISPAAVGNIENGVTVSPRQETLKRLERALKERVPEETNEMLEEESRVEGLGHMEDFDPSRTERGDWPKTAGVYVLYDKNGRPVYVGQSKCISQRLSEHSDKWWYREEIVSKASFIHIEDKMLRIQVENALIKFLKSFTVFNKNLVDKSANGEN